MPAWSRTLTFSRKYFTVLRNPILSAGPHGGTVNDTSTPVYKRLYAKLSVDLDLSGHLLAHGASGEEINLMLIKFKHS